MNRMYFYTIGNGCDIDESQGSLAVLGTGKLKSQRTDRSGCRGGRDLLEWIDPGNKTIV